jgi:hypothetical protein
VASWDGCKVPQVNAFLARDLPHTQLQWGLHEERTGYTVYKKLAHCDLAHARANSGRVRSSAAISLSDGGHSGLVDLSTPTDPYVLLGCVCKWEYDRVQWTSPRSSGHVVVATLVRGSLRAAATQVEGRSHPNNLFFRLHQLSSSFQPRTNARAVCRILLNRFMITISITISRWVNSNLKPN